MNAPRSSARARLRLLARPWRCAPAAAARRAPRRPPPAKAAVGEAAAAPEPARGARRRTVRVQPGRQARPVPQPARPSPPAQAALANATCTEPLCRFDIDQLTLVAVVSGDANPLAMVEDPQGRGYFVRRNTRVGRQGGKVTQIMSDCVVVTEYFTTPDGKTTANPVTLAIKSEKLPEQETDLATGKPY